jgi:hypothetical protein
MPDKTMVYAIFDNEALLSESWRYKITAGVEETAAQFKRMGKGYTNTAHCWE